MTTPICLWSGPRNVSTALMYSFAQRSDVRVIDEPLYAHYLRQTGAAHPARDDVLAAQDNDGESVMRQLLLEQAQKPSPRMFIKHMAHHLVGLDLGFMQSTRNIFLIRDPREMLPSLTVQIPHAALSDTGLKRQWEIFCQLSASGARPVVLDSRELLLNPAGVLRQLCAQLSIEYDAAMLSWERGPRPEDGVWAPHWYHAVHQSTGFAPYASKPDFPQRLESLLGECRPWYEKLYEHALRADATGEKSESC